MVFKILHKPYESSQMGNKNQLTFWSKLKFNIYIIIKPNYVEGIASNQTCDLFIQNFPFDISLILGNTKLFFLTGNH